MHNLFHQLPGSLPTELVTVLAENQFVRIERIVSMGHASPEGLWYDQTEHEWVTLDQPILDLHASLLSSVSKNDLKALVEILEKVRKGIRE